MSNVVDFQSVLNARRAASEVSRHAEARLSRTADEVKEFTRTHYGKELDNSQAEYIANLAIEAKEKEEAGKYVPAYCDPENERRGSRYDATENLDIKDIAKRVRKDIAAAKKAGTLPKAAKFSITIDRYSGGQSLHGSIKEWPGRVYSREYAEMTENFTSSDHAFYLEEKAGRVSKWEGPVNDALELLTRIIQSYNRDNSDSMSDYFDVRFYSSVGVSWELCESAKIADRV